MLLGPESSEFCVVPPKLCTSVSHGTCLSALAGFAWPIPACPTTTHSPLPTAHCSLLTARFAVAVLLLLGVGVVDMWEFWALKKPSGATSYRLFFVSTQMEKHCHCGVVDISSHVNLIPEVHITFRHILTIGVPY